MAAEAFTPNTYCRRNASQRTKETNAPPSSGQEKRLRIKPDTVARILEDAVAGSLGEPDPEPADAETVAAWLSVRAPGLVTWADGT